MKYDSHLLKITALQDLLREALLNGSIIREPFRQTPLPSLLLGLSPALENALLHSLVAPIVGSLAVELMAPLPRPPIRKQYLKVP